MMNDEQLIEAMAELWVSNGGDADGIVWCWHRIKEAVERKTATNNEVTG
jgi:hypothetical protein